MPVGSSPESDEESGYRAAAPLLDRADRPTAIICLSDVLALGVMRAAAERGIRVPQDLGVVGYDDITAANAAGLTTVYQPHAAKGEEAVRLLTTGGEDVLLPTDLVVRASSGPRRAEPERSSDMLDLVVNARIARALSARAVRRRRRAEARRANEAETTTPRAPVRRSAVRALRPVADRLEPAPRCAPQS